MSTSTSPALAEARQVPLPWDAIIGQARERIMARRGCGLQRPEVEEPRHRFPFCLQEASKGEHATLVFDASGQPWIRAGRVHGLREGDAVEVRADPEILVATGTLVEVFEDSARVELGPPRSGAAPRLGDTVVVREPTVRKTVRVEPEALGVPGLRAGLESSQRLAVVASGDATFSVALIDGRLQVAGPPRLQRIPRLATPQGVQAVVADLDRLARAEILLAELESPRGLPPGARPLVWAFEVRGDGDRAGPRAPSAARGGGHAARGDADLHRGSAPDACQGHPLRQRARARDLRAGDAHQPQRAGWRATASPGDAVGGATRHKEGSSGCV